ncbi:MAG: hypothetical protein A2Y76_02765 [Planctomycetes bacterium RBG_13_60_9]|nr:MAG: hypothetical protein A2Y76_02765 [Planctomycetes bacterium RBG_13_60_9]
MIGEFDDGRSKSYYCRAAALLDPAGIENALKAAGRKIKADHVPPNDAKAKAKILRAFLDALASKQGVTSEDM